MTKIILSKSAIIINKPCEKILATVSISLTERVTKRPTAVLSKYAILK